METTETTETTAMAPPTGHGPHAVGPVEEMAAALAARLGETETAPRKQIKRAVRVLGPERVGALLDRTLETERDGGLMLPDGSRRRTPGGVFFYLLRRSVTPKERSKIFRPHPVPTPVQPQEGTPETAPGPEANE